jgi:hypothetical protein
MRDWKKQFIYFVPLTAAGVLLIARLDILFTLEGAALVLLMIASGLAGIVPGQRRRLCESALESEDHTSEPIIVPAVLADKHPEHDFRYILDELHLMQNSEDLFERYQCFIRVVEKNMQQIFGDCCVTLWCPDSTRKKLYECVIKPGGLSHGTSKRAVRYPSEFRSPCIIPLDSPVIREVLQSGRPYLAGSHMPDSHLAGQAQEVTLHSDACIALYRDFGQPLLVNVECTHGSVSRCHRPDFEVVVHMLRMFWEQLQATNQRMWLVEHDEGSGALRDRAFLKQAQSRADQAMGRDDLFTFVVISIRGFRATFAGQSQQWRTVFGQIGKTLQKILHDKLDDFLLGKMADDVYALYFPKTDAFLAEVMMKHVTAHVDEEIRNIEIPDWLALDIRWALRDCQSYRGQAEALLNEIYRDLFRTGVKPSFTAHQFVLAGALGEE